MTSSTDLPNPSPMAFASARQKPSTGSGFVAEMELAFPRLAILCRSLGINLEMEFEDWARREGSAAVADWLDTSTPARGLIPSLLAQRDRSDSPLDEFVIEAHVSRRPDEFGPHLRQYRVGFSELLETINTHTADALYRWSKVLGHQRQAVMLRSLYLARDYYRELRNGYSSDGKDAPRTCS